MYVLVVLRTVNMSQSTKYQVLIIESIFHTYKATKTHTYICIYTYIYTIPNISKNIYILYLESTTWIYIKRIYAYRIYAYGIRTMLDWIPHHACNVQVTGSNPVPYATITICSKTQN